MSADERLNLLQIQTPEGIAFALPLAGPVSRFLAWVVDLGCIMVLVVAVRQVVSLAAAVSVDLANAIMTAVYFAVSVGYGMVLEWYWRGQTVGKRLLSLRVMDSRGLRLRPAQVVLRNLLRFADALPAFYLVGGVACLLSRHMQRLGDLAAGTIVVRVPRVTEPDLVQLLSGEFNSLRRYPHLAARLRREVRPEEARLALQALVRRDALEAAARLELFGELATHFREKVAFPEEATEGLSAEKYVRNVVDILFREIPRPGR